MTITDTDTQPLDPGTISMIIARHSARRRDDSRGEHDEAFLFRPRDGHYVGTDNMIEVQGRVDQFVAISSRRTPTVEDLQVVRVSSDGTVTQPRRLTRRPFIEKAPEPEPELETFEDAAHRIVSIIPPKVTDAEVRTYNVSPGVASIIHQRHYGQVPREVSQALVAQAASTPRTTMSCCTGRRTALCTVLCRIPTQRHTRTPASS
jgi:hypothetical protein